MFSNIFSIIQFSGSSFAVLFKSIAANQGHNVAPGNDWSLSRELQMCKGGILADWPIGKGGDFGLARMARAALEQDGNDPGGGPAVAIRAGAVGSDRRAETGVEHAPGFGDDA